jgi:hypothetical protein
VTNCKIQIILPLRLATVSAKNLKLPLCRV